MMKDVHKVSLYNDGLIEQQLDAMDQLEAIHAYQARKCKCHRAGAWQKIIGLKNAVTRVKEKMFKIGK